MNTNQTTISNGTVHTRHGGGPVLLTTLPTAWEREVALADMEQLLDTCAVGSQAAQHS